MLNDFREDLSDAATTFATSDLTVYFGIAGGARMQQIGGDSHGAVSRGVPATAGEATTASDLSAPDGDAGSDAGTSADENDGEPRVYRWNYRKGATAGLNGAGGATSYETLTETYGRR